MVRASRKQISNSRDQDLVCLLFANHCVISGRLSQDSPRMIPPPFNFELATRQLHKVALIECQLLTRRRSRQTSRPSSISGLSSWPSPLLSSLTHTNSMSSHSSFPVISSADSLGQATKPGGVVVARKIKARSELNTCRRWFGALELAQSCHFASFPRSVSFSQAIRLATVANKQTSVS